MLDPNHPISVLKILTPWETLNSLVNESLQKDPRGIQRNVDHHLRAMILKMYFNCSYRGLVDRLESDYYVRAFCDFEKDDICYDHTAYMKFCNELSPDVYQKINFIFIGVGAELGLTELSHFDLDSTVKEAFVTYPTDAKNLKTMTIMINKCLQYFFKNGFKKETIFALRFNLNKALKDFRKYFFEKDREKKTALLSAISKRVAILIAASVRAFREIKANYKPKVKWYIKRKLEKIEKYAEVYIKQVQHYCRTGRACKNKILSFHIQDVTPIQKGKEHKKYEFGQVWQVGRFDGNFCYGAFSESDLHFHDSSAVKKMLETFVSNVRGEVYLNIKTFAADRGYSSQENFDALDCLGILEQGIHPKGKAPWRISDQGNATELINRRAGIEPIIGHLKRLGLGKSRMKTDIGTKAEGARSFIAFNIRKILSGLAVL